MYEKKMERKGMEEQNVPEDVSQNERQDAPQKEKRSGFAVRFLSDLLRGVGIGIAFIIPGFSGGSVAAILGVYDRLVNAIADLFKSFKSSIATLLPIGIGMLLGVAALILPIQWGLANFPIPTVCLFVGLALGGLPAIFEKVKGGVSQTARATSTAQTVQSKEKLQIGHIFALLIPLIAAAGLCFLPLAGDVDLFHLNAGGYILLIVIGAVGSAALVVPGISGSMLLLIFGYYNPLVQMITKDLLHGNQVGICLLVLCLVAIGLLAGFFGISVLMKYLLKKFPRGTYFAVIGFIVGSIPAVFVSTVREAAASENASALSALYASPAYWIVAVILLLAGGALSYLLVRYARKREGKTPDTP